jgi:hypothetical protein
MISKTGMPEAVCGVGCTGMFVWLFPVVVQIQQLVVNIQQIHPDIDPLLAAQLNMASATLIFIIGAFGLVGFFFVWLFVEDAACRLYEVYCEYRDKKDEGWL